MILLAPIIQKHFLLVSAITYICVIHCTCMVQISSSSSLFVVVILSLLSIPACGIFADKILFQNVLGINVGVYSFDFWLSLNVPLFLGHFVFSLLFLRAMLFTSIVVTTVKHCYFHLFVSHIALSCTAGYMLI